MAVEVGVPEMGESISEVVLLEWLKAGGEYVEKGEPICVLETDKANVDLPAPEAGVLHPLKDKPLQRPAQRLTSQLPSEGPLLSQEKYTPPLPDYRDVRHSGL